MPKKKVEVYNKDELIYPFIESDHVSFSNGMKVSEMLNQSISMPTVAHEDLSFKVGVGDQDVSSAIVDSSVSEMTIKGKTYQNILPEPSTHVLTNNKEMFKVNEGLDPNVEIVDGVSKSAILKGRTLVNVLSRTELSDGTVNIPTIPIDKTGGYTLIAYGDLTQDLQFNFMGYNSNGEHILNCLVHVSELATPKYFANFGDSSSDSVSEIRYRDRPSEKGTPIKYVLLKGNYTNAQIPYFEGMQSVGMPVLMTTGKNLFNFENGGQINGLMFSNNGANNYTVSGTCTKDNTDFYAVAKDRNNGIFTRLNSLPIGTKIAVSKSSSVGRQVYLSITQKDGSPTKYVQTYTTTNNDNVIHCFIRFMNGDTFDNEQLNLQIEIGSTATSYEPYKSNILSTPEEVVLRSLPNGVCDTLNLVTGELVQRIGEKMLKGASNEGWIANYKGASYQFVLPIEDATSVLKDNKVATLNSDTIPSVPNHTILTEELNVEKWGIAQRNNGNKGVFIAIPASAIETYTVESFKQWLAQNPITVQYELAEPITKTVDLSSSGNWEKVVLDGSKDNLQHYPPADGANTMMILVLQDGVANVTSSEHCFSDKLISQESWSNGKDVESIWCQESNTNNILRFRIAKSKLVSQDIVGVRQYLSQNPITVWYQTQAHQDSTQVKQPIFFKDGHIMQSSGADNSLIPTLDYQAKTSNSYVMDLMKLNTQYTMKAKTVSGTFTIDGTSYGAGTNGTFTTPSSMTNKFLVMNNKTNEEVMILEGDVASKTIPYFKGIKSAFEDESKIEVLSTGKNLFDGSFKKGNINSSGLPVWSDSSQSVLSDFIQVKPSSSLVVSNYGNVGNVYFCEYDSEGNYLGAVPRNTCITKINTKFIRIQFNNPLSSLDELNRNTQVEGSAVATTHEPYKSNSTKIPLLSPLRSLPNGVKDEVILDRENNKAKIIQRVGRVVFNGSQRADWTTSYKGNNTMRFDFNNSLTGASSVITNTMVCDKFCGINDFNSDVEGIRRTGTALVLRVTYDKLTTHDSFGISRYLSQNPMTVYYELTTPIITEINLEGFPYVYKDGHIFLNSEISPTTEITYSINQCQQISASNEDIIRHEKELTYLQKLIAQYVKVDYESALLSLKV